MLENLINDFHSRFMYQSLYFVFDIFTYDIFSEILVIRD